MIAMKSKNLTIAKPSSRTRYVTPVKCCATPEKPSDKTPMPDRSKMKEIRKLNGDRMKNIMDLADRVKSTINTELELRKKIIDEVVKLGKEDIQTIQKKCKNVKLNETDKVKVQDDTTTESS